MSATHIFIHSLWLIPMDHPGHLWNCHRGEGCSCLIKSTFEAICCLNLSYPFLSATSSLGHKQTAVYTILQAPMGLTSDPYCRSSIPSLFSRLTLPSLPGAIHRFRLSLAPQPVGIGAISKTRADSRVLMGEGRTTIQHVVGLRKDARNGFLNLCSVVKWIGDALID